MNKLTPLLLSITLACSLPALADHHNDAPGCKQHQHQGTEADANKQACPST